MRTASVLVIVFILSISNALYGTTINYTTSNLGGNRWEYLYDVWNDTIGSPIQEFTIYFDYGLYDNLNIDTPKADWDAITVNPDLILGMPAPGFYDALALLSGIAPGATEGGFEVSFDWLSAGVPGVQSFDIVNPSDFTVLDSGDTVPAAAPVPEPATLLLVASGIIGLISVRRK